MAAVAALGRGRSGGQHGMVQHCWGAMPYRELRTMPADASSPPASAVQPPPRWRLLHRSDLKPPAPPEVQNSKQGVAGGDVGKRRNLPLE